MTTLHVTTLGIYALVLVVWLTRHLMVSRIRRKTPILTPNDLGYQADDPPLVSVLIPANAALYGEASGGH